MTDMRLSVNLSSACERVSMAQVSRQERHFGRWQVERAAAAASTPADAWREWRWTRLRRRLRHRSRISPYVRTQIPADYLPSICARLFARQQLMALIWPQS